MYSKNYNAISSMDSENNNLELKDSRMSRDDLESHANVVVVGKNFTMITEIGRHSEVSSLTSDY